MMDDGYGLVQFGLKWMHAWDRVQILSVLSYSELFMEFHILILKEYHLMLTMLSTVKAQ